MKAYLDIETDRAGNICVIGLSIENNGFMQWYGKHIDIYSVEQELAHVKTIVTFNGDGFDLPHIKKHLNVDLKENRVSRDLFKEKKKLGIKGGLKDLEKMFGITRKTEGMNGYKAVWLWERYKHKGNVNALNLLLEYNKEDVLNLIALEKILDDLGGGAAL
ncbi:MAG TPA: ribonuclease H-like domain-containing protein [Syntrophorhabdaceae bacterium]|nr:ribonuclease H-like domain-containing protein [Syntrophorhabdaceae bacterium]